MSHYDGERVFTIHKARPQDDSLGVSACAVCGAPVKRVPGGRGPVWVHTETGTVVGSGSERGDGAADA